MPKKLTEKNHEYFVFSVATKIRVSSGGFGELINQIVRERIKLRRLSAFVVGQRT